MKTTINRNTFIIILITLISFTINSCTKEDETPTFRVVYDGNQNTGGSVPIDNNTYLTGDTVIVLGNTQTLTKQGFSFANWNTSSDGNGANYFPDQKFAMSKENLTLYATWVEGGKLTVSITNSSEFNGNSLYFMILDSNSYNHGVGIINISNGEGTAITRDYIDYYSEKVFENGIYYLMGFVDMNGNEEPDSGDRYGELIMIEINGDTYLSLTESDFPYTIP